MASTRYPPKFREDSTVLFHPLMLVVIAFVALFLSLFGAAIFSQNFDQDHDLRLAVETHATAVAYKFDASVGDGSFRGFFAKRRIEETRDQATESLLDYVAIHGYDEHALAAMRSMEELDTRLQGGQ